jgi:hypothetical protein
MEKMGKRTVLASKREGGRSPHVGKRPREPAAAHRACCEAEEHR